MNILKIPQVSPKDRFFCAVSAFGSIMFSLVWIIATISGILYFLNIVETHTSAQQILFVFFMCLLVAITALVLFAGWLVATDAIQSRKRRRLEGLEVPSIFASTIKTAFLFGVPMLVEYYALTRWAALNITAIGGDIFGQRIASALFVQIISTVIGSMIWAKMEGVRIEIERFASLFLLMLIPLWATPFYGAVLFVVPTMDVHLAAWVAWAGTIPFVAMILGAAYSCEENIFDKLGLRS